MSSRTTRDGTIELSHPSIRIKGTENDFLPMNCIDPRCKLHTAAHMHCPFCVKSDTFFDDRILKVHYSVKHVDKGIEFAGLKILRCCEHCEIVGVIKGEKKIKCGHWHCYKCRNGFNRRDEAIKHYKTHFKQPYSTFQIHIAQDVNNVTGYKECGAEDLELIQDTITDYVAKETSFSMASRKALGTPVILKATEDKISGEILDELADCSSPSNNTIECPAAITLIRVPEENMSSGQGQAYLEKLVEQLQEQVLHISDKKVQMETKLQTHIEYLMDKIKRQEIELVKLRNSQSETSLTSSQSQPVSSSKIDQLVASMKEQHSQLLTEQLEQMRREAYHTLVQDGKIPCPKCESKNNPTHSSGPDPNSRQTVHHNSNQPDELPDSQPDEQLSNNISSTNHLSTLRSNHDHSLSDSESDSIHKCNITASSDCNDMTAFTEKDSSACTNVRSEEENLYLAGLSSTNNAQKRKFDQVT